MRYVIACNLNGDIVEYHKKLVSEIAQNFGVIFPLKQNFEPHFTLKYGFEATDIKEVESIIEKFCASHKKTPIKAGGFKSFRNDVIFLDIKLSDEAHQVFLEFINEIKKISWLSWKEHDGENLNFHATIAADCEKNYAEILNFIEGKKQLFNCWFDNITIWKENAVIDGVTTWDIHKTFAMH